MRLYSFTHYMLSSMAQGIQASHATVELFNKYIPNPSNNGEVLVSELNSYDLLWDWSNNHKTMISLNGGLTPDLRELIDFLEFCDYPWAFFEEDDSLGGLITSVAMILPEKIYLTAELIRNKEISRAYYGFAVKGSNSERFFEIKTFLDEQTYSSFDFKLIERLNTYRMAK